MQELVISNKTDLVEIADAIRGKIGTTDALSLDEMPSLITNISGSSDGNITYYFDVLNNTSTTLIIGAESVIPGDTCRFVLYDEYDYHRMFVGMLYLYGIASEDMANSLRIVTEDGIELDYTYVRLEMYMEEYPGFLVYLSDLEPHQLLQKTIIFSTEEA